MAGEDEIPGGADDHADELGDPSAEFLGDDTDEDGDGDGNDDLDSPEMAEAAAAIEFVILPIACTSEGRGAPLAMGVQRWWAQELASRGAKAAAPVFTALAEQKGRKVPALMVFREPWTDERAREGIARFANARHGLITDMRVEEKEIAITARLMKLEGETLQELEKWSSVVGSDELGAKVVEMLRAIAKHFDVVFEHEDWKQAFGTTDPQALTSFLVGLGNLSALQGRCVPTTPDQLLSPLVDALNRDPKMDLAMQGLHMMADILTQNPIDQSAIPLSLQALSVAAGRRKTDKNAFHHLAVLFRRLGDVGSSVNAFNQAFNLDPTDDQITCQFIDTLRGAGDRANAMKVAEFAAEKGNESPRLMARIGSLMIENDRFDEAEPFLRRSIDDGQVPSAYGDLANVLWDRSDETSDQGKEDRQEALNLLRTAVDADALAKSTLDMLLDLHEEEKSEEATVLLLKAAEKHPSSATVLRYVATMYLEGDLPEKSREYLEKILALPRRSLDDDAFARRGRLTLNIEDFEERYDQAIESVRTGGGEGAKPAITFLRQIIAADDKFWQPHLMLALAVREAEGDAAALGHLTSAVKLRPNDAEIRNLIAAILRKQGRPKDAVDHLRAVVALNPRDVEPVASLATCMRDANMFEEARSVCQAALQMLPDHAEFKRILESLPPAKNA